MWPSQREQRHSVRLRQLARIPGAKRGKRRMRKIALEIAGDPGDVSEITALAVTFRQPRKYAENLRVALGAERCVEHAELIARKLPIARASGGTVASQQLGFKRFGHIEAGVLQERHKIVSGRALEGILEVEDADLLEAGPLRQPHQVRRVIIS